MTEEVTSSMLIVETAEATTGENYTGEAITLGEVDSATDSVMVHLTMEVEDKNASLSANAKLVIRLLL